MSEDFSNDVPNDAAPATDAVSVEISELVAESADTTGPYWNSAQAETKQARLRELYELQDGAQPGPEDGPRDVALGDADVSGSLDALADMGEVGQAFAEQLERGGAQNAIQTINSVSSDILDGMGASADDVSAAFDGLPSNVQASVYREFASAYVPPQPAAGADDLATFAASGTGQILTREWGESAGRNLATALFRWDRMTEGMSERETAQIDDFYLHRLDAGERAAVLRRLAA